MITVLLWCVGAVALWIVASIPLALVIGRMIANAEREHEAHVAAARAEKRVVVWGNGRIDELP